MANLRTRKPKQAPALVVLIPGAGRWGTQHPFFPECEKEFRARGFHVVISNVNDAEGITPIGDKVRQTVLAVNQHIESLKPSKVIVIGHSQGYLTGGNAIEAWKEQHPGIEFYLFGVCNPRSRKDHDQGFNRYLRIMRRRPLKPPQIRRIVGRMKTYV